MNATQKKTILLALNRIARAGTIPNTTPEAKASAHLAVIMYDLISCAGNTIIFKENLTRLHGMGVNSFAQIMDEAERKKQNKE